MTHGSENMPFAGRAGLIPDWITLFVSFLLRYRNSVKLLLTVGIFSLSYITAYLLRFELVMQKEYLSLFVVTLPLLLGAKSAAFLSLGLYRGWWRYVSLQDVPPILAGCTLGSILFAVAVYLFHPSTPVPRSVFILDWGNTVLMVLGMRFIVRLGRETFGRRKNDSDRRVLVVGAGSAGQMIVREIRENPGLGMIEVGFVDDDPRRSGPGSAGSGPGFPQRHSGAVLEHRIDEIIIAIPSAQAVPLAAHPEPLRGSENQGADPPRGGRADRRQDQREHVAERGSRGPSGAGSRWSSTWNCCDGMSAGGRSW